MLNSLQLEVLLIQPITHRPEFLTTGPFMCINTATEHLQVPVTAPTHKYWHFCSSL